MTERIKFIAACAEERGASLAELCRRFGISRQTGYKWLARYEAEGASGLEDREPVARQCPHRTDDALVDAIVALRKEHPTWGPKKLRAVLQGTQPGHAWPAASTIGDVLSRQGLIRPRRRRVRIAPSASPLGPQVRPNDVWCIDFKGDFALGDRSRCYPLTITDGASRYLIKCEALASTQGEPVRRQFELAFAEFGLPSRIRSDNGTPFASAKAAGGLSALAVWWIQLGITPERIEPGQPQQNGRHERMHRTLKAEATRPAQRSAVEQQRVFDRFRHEYNDVRPHEALGQTPPRQHYEPSLRSYPRELVCPSYGDEYAVRWVDAKGCMKWRGSVVPLTKLLVNQPVGIRQVTETGFEVHYGSVLLGTLDARDEAPKLRRTRGIAPAPANGDGDGSAFPCGQPADGLPTGKPPSPAELAINE